MTIRTSYERVSLDLETPFTIARGTTSETENFIVRLTDEDGMTGIGGAAPTPRYGETPATVAAVLPELLEIVEEIDDPHALHALETRMKDRVSGNPAARCGVSIAAHDLAARRLGTSLHRMWGLTPSHTPVTSFTIGLDTTERMRQKATAAAADHSVLKLKLGVDRDREIVETVREAAPDTRLRVDANEAWTPKETVAKSAWLADNNVEFIEQPVSAEDPAGLKFVYEHSPLPIAVDESCVTLADIPRVADRADIATIKLMKCGGLLEARRMIATARAHGLEIMLGCMVESNASIAAGCQLAPLLDYADLDGSLLLASDPIEGVDLSTGHIRIGERDIDGTGAREP